MVTIAGPCFDSRSGGRCVETDAAASGVPPPVGVREFGRAARPAGDGRASTRQPLSVLAGSPDGSVRDYRKSAERVRSATAAARRVAPAGVPDPTEAPAADSPDTCADRGRRPRPAALGGDRRHQIETGGRGRRGRRSQPQAAGADLARVPVRWEQPRYGRSRRGVRHLTGAEPNRLATAGPARKSACRRRPVRSMLQAGRREGAVPGTGSPPGTGRAPPPLRCRVPGFDNGDPVSQETRGERWATGVRSGKRGARAGRWHRP